jgi:hypothetical protein
MMTSDQAKSVAEVYRRFIDAEGIRGWTEVDDYLDALSWLDDDQLHREADVVFEIHKRGQVKCMADHDQSKCFVPRIVEVVGYILELYKETGNLHKNNRYILEYYLAYQQAGMIITY